MSVGPIEMYKANRGRIGARLSNFNQRYMQGLFGKSLKAGTIESFGWNLEGFAGGAKNYGFLGWQKWGDEFAGITRNASGAITKTASTAGGIRGAGRVAFGTAGRAIPLLATAYFTYEGYQREGVWGAAKGMGESIAYSAAFHYIGGALGGAGVGVLGAVGAAGLATYTLGEAGREKARGLRQLEMGQSDQMQATVHSAGAATMRQRSLMALNNTHLNGRMALGNEGFLMHRSFA